MCVRACDVVTKSRGGCFCTCASGSCEGDRGLHCCAYSTACCFAFSRNSYLAPSPVGEPVDSTYVADGSRLSAAWSQRCPDCRHKHVLVCFVLCLGQGKGWYDEIPRRAAQNPAKKTNASFCYSKSDQHTLCPNLTITARVFRSARSSSDTCAQTGAATLKVDGCKTQLGKCERVHGNKHRKERRRRSGIPNQTKNIGCGRRAAAQQNSHLPNNDISLLAFRSSRDGSEIGHTRVCLTSFSFHALSGAVAVPCPVRDSVCCV